MTAELTHKHTLGPEGGVCTACGSTSAEEYVRIEGIVETSSQSDVFQGQVSYLICGSCIGQAASMIGVGTRQTTRELDQALEAAEARLKAAEERASATLARLSRLFAMPAAT